MNVFSVVIVSSDTVMNDNSYVPLNGDVLSCRARRYDVTYSDAYLDKCVTSAGS
jgi:hypothetical protein